MLVFMECYSSSWKTVEVVLFFCIKKESQQCKMVLKIAEFIKFFGMSTCALYRRTQLIPKRNCIQIPQAVVINLVTAIILQLYQNS
jgi:hypothetical protein